ncbi:MAG: prephenate dehydrogenase [SAR324 cluster bacterium]|nr:prephenate dehydrogenase [SAR324 cluster bacterium]
MSSSGITPFGTLAVVGLGLIGGSFARDVRRLGLAHKLIGYDNNAEYREKIRSLNLVDYLAAAPDEKLSEAELVLLAVPVKAFAKVLVQIRPHLSASAIVTDTGSVKSPLLKIMSSPQYEEINFVGGHPIAGSEHFGPGAAQEKLFSEKRFILTPGDNTEQDVVERVSGLWQSLGAEVSEMDSEAHDKIFASVSHLPHLLAYASIQAIANSDTPEALGHSGAGLKDFSRIASSSPEMWADIFLENSQNLQLRINIFKNVLCALEGAVKEKDKQKLIKLLAQAKKERDRWMS